MRTIENRIDRSSSPREEIGHSLVHLLQISRSQKPLRNAALVRHHDNAKAGTV